ncbi:MAG: hypothetical protein AAGE52_38395 [Myxococcota bacterium]
MEPEIRPSLLWTGAQLLPSVDVSFGDSTRAGLHWQVTPLLWSWGMNRQLSPWRAFVAEPLTRQNGSLELFVAPGVTFGETTTASLRTGLRAYIPLVEHGEGMSISFGAGYARYRKQNAAALEVGAYFLFGVLGLQLTYLVNADIRRTVIASIRLRYF